MAVNFYIFTERSVEDSRHNPDVAVDFGAMTLRDAFRNPDNISALLLFQSDVSVEDAELKLSHEGVNHQLHLNSIHKSLYANSKVAESTRQLNFAFG